MIRRGLLRQFNARGPTPASKERIVPERQEPDCQRAPQRIRVGSGHGNAAHQGRERYEDLQRLQ